MRIALAQINAHIANTNGNTHHIIEYILEAQKQQADLIIFPELAICGYPPRDFLNFDEFIEACNQSIKDILPHTEHIAVIVGVPVINAVPEGKDLYNAALLIEHGAVKATVCKTLLPDYDVFDEYRYFEANNTFECVEVKGIKIALTICEDLWNLNKNPLYIKTPMDELIKQRPQLMVNIAASPFSNKQTAIRKNVLVDNAKRYALPLIYVNQVGAQTELVFDGNSQMLDAEGNTLVELPSFQEQLHIVEFDAKQQPHASFAHHFAMNKPEEELVHQAIVTGIREYFTKSGFKKAILGLSGGVDSALVTAYAAEALGSENILPVLLPSPYSSGHSITDSEILCRNLGIEWNQISIAETFESVKASLNPFFGSKPEDITEENMQSRIRALFLMALSNKHGYILLNTSNKSELAVGYGTLYGDMCGGLSVIGDLYKTQVYAQCRYINRDREIIPENILSKAPSAELRPDQKDSDSLPEYEVLDAVLALYIEQHQSANHIIAKGFDEALVRRVLKLVNQNEYKRKQTPPIIRVSANAFGSGRRMPIVAYYGL